MNVLFGIFRNIQIVDLKIKEHLNVQYSTIRAGRNGQVHAVNIAGHKETKLYSVIDPYQPMWLPLADKAKVQTTEEACKTLIQVF